VTPSPGSPSREDDIADLRRRLEEADQLVGAIAQGSVDAVVVGPDEERKRVLMLSGAYGRYRQIVEDMRDGAVTVTPNGEIIFVNRSFSELLGLSGPDLFRKPLHHFVAIQNRAEVAALCGARSRRAHGVALQREDGTSLMAALSVVAANDGFTTILVTQVGADDHGPARPSASRDPETASWADLVDRMDQPALVASADGRILHANERLTSLLEMAPGGVDGLSVGDLFVYESRDGIGRALASGHRGGAQSEASLRRDSAELPVIVTVTRIDAWRVCLFKRL
jgi:PAS domain S-box-containing protein